MKNLLLFIFLIFFSCSANAGDIWQNDEKPLAGVADYAKPIDENVKTFSYDQVTEYLKNLYDSNAYIDKDFYNVSVKNDTDKVIGELLYNRDLELVIAGDKNSSRWFDEKSKFKRFYIVYNSENDKYGIYDTKKKKFTGFKYNSDEVKNTFSGVPTVINNGKKICIQPYKRVGNAIARGSFKTGEAIILLPCIILASPIIILGLYIYIIS